MPIDTSILDKKAAKAAYDREYRRANAVKLKAAKKLWAQGDVKKAYDKKWVEEHKERSLEIRKAYRDRNPEKTRAYTASIAERRVISSRAHYLANTDALKKKTKDWRRANPHHASALAGKRAAAVRRATPAWANAAKMRVIYLEARATGMEVDHRVPLQGKTVCGLHVEHNLRIVTRHENRQKGARHAD